MRAFNQAIAEIRRECRPSSFSPAFPVIFEGKDLTKLRSRREGPTRYSIDVARRVLGEEALKVGIIEPKRPTKRAIITDEEKVNLIKGNIFSFLSII